MMEPMQDGQMDVLYEKTLNWLKSKAKESGGVEGLWKKMRAKRATAYKVLNEDKGTNARDYLSWLEALGAKIVFPDEKPDLSREIRWVNAKIVPAGEGHPLPPAEDYFAVPLVGEVGAGPGVMSEDKINSWVLVYQHQDSIRFKRNLLAVEIDTRSTSMLPLLRPGDIVLVNRDDFRPDKPGGIFLVREPGQEGGAMVKRVAAKKENGDIIITFYSDNAAENPPSSHSLREKYDGNISNAIVGRCVWSWSDLSGK